MIIKIIIEKENSQVIEAWGAFQKDFWALKSKSS